MYGWSRDLVGELCPGAEGEPVRAIVCRTALHPLESDTMNLEVHQMAIAAERKHLLNQAARTWQLAEEEGCRMRQSFWRGHASAARFRMLVPRLRQVLGGMATTSQPASALPV